MANHSLCDTPQEQMPQARPAMGGHDDQIGTNIIRDAIDLMIGMSSSDKDFDLLGKLKKAWLILGREELSW